MSRELSYPSLLRACGESRNLAQARKLHAEIHQATNSSSSIYIDNLIVEMYGKCGGIEEARWVFDRMINRNVFSWTIMIAAFARNGQCELSLLHFWRMNLEGVKPDRIGLVTIIDSVCDIASETDIMLLRKCIIELGLESDLILGNALLNLYSNGLSLEQTRQRFEEMPERDVITWTCIVAAHVRMGKTQEALDLFQRMDLEGVKPNAVTFLSLTAAFSELRNERHCRSNDSTVTPSKQLVHNLVMRISDSGCLAMVVVACSLIEMYGKLGRIDEAVQVFENADAKKNVVVWTTMLTAFSHNGRGPEAFDAFRRMEVEGVEPDDVTLLSVLDACTRSESLKEGRLAHLRIYELGFDSYPNVANSLVKMYGKCGCLESARAVFQSLDSKSAVAWTALITANADAGQPLQSFELFLEMDLEGIQPTLVTLVTLVDVCSELADSSKGRVVLDCIQDLGFCQDGILGNALVNMYGKCGNTERAKQTFVAMKDRDFCAWNAMVAAYAHGGRSSHAVLTMQEMELEGIQATEVTFVNVLTALSHAGLVEKCLECLVCMIQDYEIAPVGEHYRCVVDMLARLGQLQLAKELTERLPFEATAAAWMSFLSASSSTSSSTNSSSSFEHAQTAARSLFTLEPENASPYLALSNMYRSPSIKR